MDQWSRLGQSFPHALAFGVELGPCVVYLHVSEPGSSPFGLPVPAPIGPRHEEVRVLEWVKVPHWLGKRPVIHLYGLGQSLHHELVLELA